MNKLCCLIIMFITCEVCSGQNLVPNPSFEDTVTCPPGLSNMDKAQYWSSYRSTPDYFNVCATVQVGVPNNFFGYQVPHTGNAYAGAYCFAPTENYREFIGAALNQSLNIGTKYYLSVYLSRVDGHSWSSDHFGFKFSNVSYNYTNPVPVNNFAHYYSTTIVTDSIGWTKISGSFIADSTYQYVILGNFFDSISTNFIVGWYLNDVSYYLIDDVCVSADSLTCNPTVGINEINKKEELILFPNPFSDKINITAKRNESVELKLLDVTGRKIFNQTFTNSTTINTEQLAKGVYLYEVRKKNGVIKKGKVVKD